MMKAVFYFPNGYTEEKEFITDKFQYTEVYYNELAPADNSARLRIPFDIDFSNKLKIYANDDVKVEIKNDDDSNYFTGYLRKNFSFEKTQRNQPISVELVSPSFLVRKELTSSIFLLNKTVTEIITLLLTTIGFTDIAELDITDIVTVFTAQDGDDISEIITQLLYEHGYTFDFDNNGAFITYTIFDQPPETITQVFDGETNLKKVSQTCTEEKFTNIQGSWGKIEYKENILLFRDTQGADAAHQAQIPVEPRSYIFGTEYNYLEYDSTFGDVKYVTSITDEIIYDNVMRKSLENEGTRAKLSIYNMTDIVRYVTKMEIYGNAYVQTATNKSVVQTGNKLYEFDILYLNDKAKINLLIQNIANYYKYADFSFSLQSKTNFPLGSFVTVSEYGMGEITGRIISKTYQLNKPINYVIEAVAEFVPADVPETETTVDWNDSGEKGPTGDTGDYFEVIYTRADTRPDRPTGDTPTGWSNDLSTLSGTEIVWQSTGRKNAAGTLQGNGLTRRNIRT
ncbi:hypothetical protein K7I13_12165 [Brucepastera parasyntrophica]|uniref:hypothetical protein n=1 Tax=Brucepastera parasyntrophica TaxID=2880008 RepID=UPI00210E3F5B|nr:hypothetical protein [Brucepastera parasyntrophica]ULQ59240.1 hypothetical protein K7I13_12165 [Brucepastera parasyntrophica]